MKETLPSRSLQFRRGKLPLTAYILRQSSKRKSVHSTWSRSMGVIDEALQRRRRLSRALKYEQMCARQMGTGGVKKE